LTDPQNADTDHDGFDDKTELINGYSPLFADKRITEVDTDSDGLNDGLELAFGTKINNPDTDRDGYLDGEEVKNGYNPASADNKKLEKKIEVDISDQRLDYFLGRARLGSFQVSTGKNSTPTPLGEFTIADKDIRRESKVGQLIMPYWMAFKDDLYAIHDLPEWPNGKKEGADHLGKKVSHGCVRLATANAKFLYDWTPVGTKVAISN
jgi:lipoprotein-anchoring transpeptidase ErfK/SrfK